MKKYNNKDYIYMSSLILIFLIILFSIVGFRFVNGSTIDWESQHWIFPEYFRTLFYKTRDLFPSFAFNLGAGQNIYNLSYYGLLSPIVIISYLFPHVRMVDYIQVIMILVVISSIILMYIWLRNKFDSKISFIGTLLFLLSGPLIYHTHRHIMFISYMPFLIMSLIGVDHYFDNNKKTLLIISLFMVIMSSYYYSVGSILCVIIYGIYSYISKNDKITFKIFVKEGLKFLFPIFVAVMMSMIIILPTFYTLISSRADITESINILSLLVPNYNIRQMLYSSYTIGLTYILVIAILNGFVSKKENKFLSVVFTILIIFPIVIYLLSGFTYVRGKVLIPLLPIAVLLVINFINNLRYKNNRVLNILIIIVSIFTICFYYINKEYIFILDIIIVVISYFISLHSKNKKYLIYPLCFCSLICCLVNNYSDTLVSKEDISLQHNTYNYSKLNILLDSDDNLHRVGNLLGGLKDINRVINDKYYLSSIYSSLENQNYYNFYNNDISNEMENRISTAITSSNNILFNTLMSTKYLISNDGLIGYKNIDNTNIFVNDNVLPIGFSSSKVLGKKTYESLEYPENAYSLVTNIIAGDIVSEYKNKTKKVSLKYKEDISNLTIDKTEDTYVINSDNNGYINLKLDKGLENKLLFIKFKMNKSESCKVGDTSITINGVKNTLSCSSWTYHNNNYNFEYVIGDKNINELNIVFSKGRYIISDIETYTLDYEYITNFVNSVDEFKIDKESTFGDIIVGNINVNENGYFMITIPYEEKGYSIYLDDNQISYEKVNNAFIGFPINEGHHEIKIIYTSPYLFEGMVCSILGYVIFIPIIYSDIFRKKIKHGK